MKPRIELDRELGCWTVRHQPRTGGYPVTALRLSWPDALGVLGIACPDGWRGRQ